MSLGIWFQGGHDWRAEPLPRTLRQARRVVFAEAEPLHWWERIACGFVDEAESEDPYDVAPMRAVGSAIVTSRRRRPGALCDPGDAYCSYDEEERARPCSPAFVWPPPEKMPKTAGPWASDRYVVPYLRVVSMSEARAIGLAKSRGARP